MQALSRIDGAADPSLLAAALRNENPNIRFRAALVLANRKDPEAVIPLLRALSDVIDRIRHAATKLTAAKGDPTEACLNAYLRASVLGSKPSSDARKNDKSVLIEDLEVIFGFVRFQTVEALVKMAPLIQKSLVTLMRTGNSTVASVAAETLERVGWRPSAQTETAALLFAQENYAAAEELGSSATASFVRGLRDNYMHVRWIAAKALGKIKDRRAVEPMLRSLADKSTLVRTDIVRSLGEIGDRKAVPALVEALEDREPSVRGTAAEALGKMGDALAVEPLLTTLIDEDETVRWMCAQALVTLNDGRLQVVMPYLKTMAERKLSKYYALLSMDEILHIVNCVKNGKPILAEYKHYVGHSTGGWDWVNGKWEWDEVIDSPAQLVV